MHLRLDRPQHADISLEICHIGSSASKIAPLFNNVPSHQYCVIDDRYDRGCSRVLIAKAL
ncbi:hypothetical protein CY34DRAFT_797579 [Suillus luteus UH-Slu-Lm8-n1]|uniref:Uncharacterized protein n=1 Tax=Suillus luteus UH-Slu-Lm8-n1 TaxID=930992 RepID=A0A0D0BUH3_9AGAM|nr:hypothetical protein CY34DRAFT_797579 [Suillus luteus UH-Slu-Lm8-n1]